MSPTHRNGRSPSRPLLTACRSSRGHATAARDQVGYRVVVASGETAERPRRLTTPRAVTESHTPAEASSFRCLDLDGPTMEDRSRPQTMQANYCIVGDERIEPSGGLGGVPGFAGTRTSCTARCRRRSAGYWG